MTPTSRFVTRSVAHRLCWHSADSADACLVMPIAGKMAVQIAMISWRKPAAVRSGGNSRHTNAAKPIVLPTTSITRKSEPAAKSP